MIRTLEMQCLAQCLPPAPGSRQDPAEYETSLDWNRLLDLARWHGMLSLLTRRLLSGLNGQPDPAAPAYIVTALRSHQSDLLYRTLIQTSALLELQHEFDRSGLKVVPWKGPSVGLLLYGSATLRESGDLDFLYYDKDFPQVQDLLSRLGYFGQDIKSEKDRYEFAHQHEFSSFRSRDQILLEFHSQILTSRFSAWQDSETYITRADVRLPLADTSLLLQCPEDLLLSLCIHAAKHNWDRLKWSCDIALFLRQYHSSLDWSTYLADLAKEGKHSIVLVGLALAANLFDLVLPQPVLAALERAPRITLLANQLGAHLKSGSMTPVPRRLASGLVALLCPTLYDRLVYVLSPIVRLEYEDLYIADPKSSLFSFNYVYRFWRLLRRHGLQRLVSMTAVYIRSGR